MKLGILTVALGALAAISLAPAASAQVTGVVVNRNVQIDAVHMGFDDGGNNTFSYNGDPGDQATQYNLSAPAFGITGAQNVQVATHIDNTAGYIDFANNATSEGTHGTVITTTSIAVSLKNGASNPVNASLTSTISPAGFGFYQADLTGNINGDINQNAESTTHIIGYGNGYLPQAEETFGRVGVSFQILALDHGGNLTTLADFSATLSAYRTGGDVGAPAGPFFDLQTASSTGLTLSHFGLVAADDPLKAVGYRWDATPVTLSLGTLNPGDIATLLYVTKVTAMTSQQNLGTTDALMAYAGFGDPIGQDSGSGGIADPDFPLLQLGLPTFDPVTGKITGLNFNGYADPLPLTVSDGSQTLRTITNSTPARLSHPDLGAGAGGGAVPEPATWALLMVGFGGVGAGLRRRDERGRVRAA